MNILLLLQYLFLKFYSCLEYTDYQPFYINWNKTDVLNSYQNNFFPIINFNN